MKQQKERNQQSETGGTGRQQQLEAVSLIGSRFYQQLCTGCGPSEEFCLDSAVRIFRYESEPGASEPKAQLFSTALDILTIRMTLVRGD